MFDQVLDDLRKVADSPPQVKLVEDWSEYLVDSVQRAVLFWDMMRERGDIFLDNTGRGGPPVLVFDDDVLIDGRTLDCPCNYALMSIRAPQGVIVDPAKRPVVVVDPRAGHGSGVGGFKLDSEIGFALRAGHPVYIIGFYTEPIPGQTLVDIGKAESRFLEKVIRRYSGADNEGAFPPQHCHEEAAWAILPSMIRACPRGVWQPDAAIDTVDPCATRCCSSGWATPAGARWPRPSYGGTPPVASRCKAPGSNRPRSTL
jgi:hypothetical protein